MAKVTLPFLAICAVLFILFSADIPKSHAATHVQKRFVTDTVPHSFDDNVKCSREFLKTFSKVIMGSNCKPRPTVVEIFLKQHDLLVVPSKVMVNRCEGVCHAKQSCLATEKKEVPIKVQHMSILDPDSMPKCGLVYVEEHTRCMCACTVMKEHCNERQMYQPGECNCLCMNKEERQNCLDDGKQWDESNCSCMCPVEKECTTGQVWIKEYCSCAKLMGDEDENEVE